MVSRPKLKGAINEATECGVLGRCGRRRRELRKCDKTKGQSCTNNTNNHSNLVPRKPDVHGVTTPGPSLPGGTADRTIGARYGGGAPPTTTLALVLRVVRTSEPSSGSINSGLQARLPSPSPSLLDSNPRALELRDVRGV